MKTTQISARMGAVQVSKITDPELVAQYEDLRDVTENFSDLSLAEDVDACESWLKIVEKHFPAALGTQPEKPAKKTPAKAAKKAKKAKSPAKSKPKVVKVEPVAVDDTDVEACRQKIAAVKARENEKKLAKARAEARAKGATDEEVDAITLNSLSPHKTLTENVSEKVVALFHAVVRHNRSKVKNPSAERLASIKTETQQLQKSCEKFLKEIRELVTGMGSERFLEEFRGQAQKALDEIEEAIQKQKAA